MKKFRTGSISKTGGESKAGRRGGRNSITFSDDRITVSGNVTCNVSGVDSVSGILETGGEGYAFCKIKKRAEKKSAAPLKNVMRFLSKRKFLPTVTPTANG